jgi:hypothetical protein
VPGRTAFVIAGHGRVAMPPSIAALNSRRALDSGAPRILWRFGPLALFHLAALYFLLTTEEYDFAYITGFLLAWGILNFAWIALLRRPAAAALLSLALIVPLIEISKYKVSIVAQTVNFMDIMVIDPATVAFLFALFPGYRIYVVVALFLLALSVLVLWRIEVLRMSRRIAAAAGGACLIALVALSYTHPFEVNWWGHGHVSNFARSAIDAAHNYLSTGFLESDAITPERLALALDETCQPTSRPPHIIVVHDESAFDLRKAPNIRVPAGYEAHFRSFDGKQRDLIVESMGGASWYAEYNLLAGLSTRSFGPFSFFVTRIAAGRVERGLPKTLRRCGYRTFSLYPYNGAFLSAKSFHTGSGVQGFYDMAAMHAKEFEPDRFYYDAAVRLIERERARGTGPLFVYVYLSANHSPWDNPWRPELTPEWTSTGNERDVDEYLRRQVLGMHDYRTFLAALQRAFPDEPFLLLRYGDHQPYFTPRIMEPGRSETEVWRSIHLYDPRYFTTYYAIDTVNFRPMNTSSALETIEAPYIPLVVLEAAGLPLDPSFVEQRRILERCRGMFYRCAGGAEVRRFNRLLINAGLIKGL